MPQSEKSSQPLAKCRDPQVWVLALGSPHGDDRVGWLVAEQLAADPRIAPLVRQMITPWDLLHHVQTGDSLVLVDACRGVAEPGSVTQLAEADLPRLSEADRSTHGVSLREAIALARQLRGPLAETVAFAIEVGDCQPGGELSPAAELGGQQAVECIREHLAKRGAILDDRANTLSDQSRHA